MKRKWEIWLSDKNQLNIDFESCLKKKILRKIEPANKLSMAHLDKAFHNLDLASFIFSSQDKINKRITEETYNDAVIIFSYYSMYHAALAILYNLGFKSKAHLATICFLCKKCTGLDKAHITGISKALELKNIREIGEGQSRRETASYNSSVSFDAKLAEMTLSDARDFVNKVKSILIV